MQADRFTVKSQEAVATAQRLAAANRNPEVVPQHLLLALLEQEDGFAPAALRKLSADVSAITDRARAAVDELPRVGGDTEPEIRPSQSFISVLQRVTFVRKQPMGHLGLYIFSIFGICIHSRKRLE